MKYGEENTSKGSQTKRHGHTTKPAYTRYFSSRKWIDNKKRRIEKDRKRKEKIKEKE